MKQSMRALTTAVFATAISSVAFADVTSIDSAIIEERRFNDFPDTTLNTTNNFPAEVQFTEQNYSGSGFANRHDAIMSADGGATVYTLDNDTPFDISVDVNLFVGSVSPRKEAGWRMDTNLIGEQFFQLTSDGEVAAFGGALPFHTFGGDAYTPGETVTLRMVYTPDDDDDAGDGDAATMEYFLNDVSSGPLDFGNTENGIITGTDLRFVGQFQPDLSNPSDFAQATFTNAVFVPEPTSIVLLSLAAAAAWRRR